MAEKIGIYFGSSTGATERVALMIKNEIDSYGIADVDVQVVSVLHGGYPLVSLHNSDGKFSNAKSP